VLSITWNTLNFDHTYLAIPKVKSDDFFTKTKKIYPFETIASVHSNDHQNPRLYYHSTYEANRTFVAAKPTRLKNEKNLSESEVL
jgi:hypothetical protein